MKKPIQPPATWLRIDGSVVSCTESVKVLEENWHEAAELLSESYEDAVLLGVGKNEFKRAMHALIDALECDWAEKVGGGGASGIDSDNAGGVRSSAADRSWNR